MDVRHTIPLQVNHARPRRNVPRLVGEDNLLISYGRLIVVVRRHLDPM